MGNFSSRLANLFGGKKNPDEPGAVRAPSPGKGTPSLRDQMIASPPPAPPPVVSGAPVPVPPPLPRREGGKAGTEKIDYASAVRRQAHGGVGAGPRPVPPLPPMPAQGMMRPAVPVPPPPVAPGVSAQAPKIPGAPAVFGVPPVPSVPPLPSGSGVVPQPVAPPRPIAGVAAQAFSPGIGPVSKAPTEEVGGGEKVRPPWMSGGRKTQTLKPLPPREPRAASDAPHLAHPPAWVAGPSAPPRPAPMAPAAPAPAPISGPAMVPPAVRRPAGPAPVVSPTPPVSAGSLPAQSADVEARLPGPFAPAPSPVPEASPQPVATPMGSPQPQGPAVAKVPPNFRFRELPVLDAGVGETGEAPPVAVPATRPSPAPVPPPRMAGAPVPVAPPLPATVVPAGPAAPSAVGLAGKPPVPPPMPAPPKAGPPLQAAVVVAAKATDAVSGAGAAPGTALPSQAPVPSGSVAGPAVPRRVPAAGAATVKGIGQPIVASAQGAAPASLAARRRGSRLWSSLFLLVLLGAGAAAAYFYWMQTRETRLVCQPMLDGYKVSDSAYLMNPLVAEVERLHQRYLEQLEPLRQEQARREQAVAAAERMAKEAEAPVAAAKQAFAALEVKHKQEAVGINAQSQEQFEARFKALEAELASTRQNFQRAIADRAQRIKIDFAEDPAETEPDIVVSRFRTGLYGAGAGVDRKAEQAWAEEQLSQWRGYFEYWKSQRVALQEEFRLSQGQFGGIIEKQKAEVEKARAAMAKAEQQLKAAQDAADAARKAMGAGGFDPKKIEAELVAQMDALPEKFRLVESAARSDGKYVFAKLDENASVSPGKYVVFFRAWKDEKEYWAFSEADVVRLQETSMRVFPESLLEKRRMLLEGKFDPE